MLALSLKMEAIFFLVKLMGDLSQRSSMSQPAWESQIYNFDGQYLDSKGEETKLSN